MSWPLHSFFDPRLAIANGRLTRVFLAALCLCVFIAVAPGPQPAHAEEPDEGKRFGRWTAYTDHSTPGEKMCWLVNGELMFVVWVVEADGYRAEWLTRHGEEPGVLPGSIFYAAIDTKSFSGEESIGGPDLVGAMKAGITMVYEFTLPSGIQKGTVSLIGFTKGYRYCDEQVSG